MLLSGDKNKTKETIMNNINIIAEKDARIKESLKSIMESANPRKNAFLNTRLIYLRLKICYNMMKPRSTRFNMRVEGIDSPYCLFCLENEPVPKLETMNHLFFMCDAMRKIWDEFRV